MTILQVAPEAPITTPTTKTRTRGKFIVLEGGDGSGKTTQARMLAERLGAVHTFAPGGTQIGAELRRLLLTQADRQRPLSPRCEAMLMLADRAQQVEDVIEPALRAGRYVVSDRFIGSTVAYQGFGSGLDVDDLVSASLFASNGLQPDLVVHLDVDRSVRKERMASAHPDRFESEDDDFHRRVDTGYRYGPNVCADWVVVDGNGPIDVVAGRVGAAAAKTFLWAAYA